MDTICLSRRPFPLLLSEHKKAAHLLPSQHQLQYQLPFAPVPTGLPLYVWGWLPLLLGLPAPPQLLSGAGFSAGTDAAPGVGTPLHNPAYTSRAGGAAYKQCGL